jgi:hypothetical protein
MIVEKYKVYKFHYSGDKIKSITEHDKEVKNETFVQRNIHWIVVIVGFLVAVEWCLLWK